MATGQLGGVPHVFDEHVCVGKCWRDALLCIIGCNRSVPHGSQQSVCAGVVNGVLFPNLSGVSPVFTRSSRASVWLCSPALRRRGAEHVARACDRVGPRPIAGEGPEPEMVI